MKEAMKLWADKQHARWKWNVKVAAKNGEKRAHQTWIFEQIYAVASVIHLLTYLNANHTDLT